MRVVLVLLATPWMQDELKFADLGRVPPPKGGTISHTVSLGDLNSDGYDEFAFRRSGFGDAPALVWVANGGDRKILSEFRPDADHAYQGAFGVLARGNISGGQERELILGDPEAPIGGVDFSGEILIACPLTGEVISKIEGESGSYFGTRVRSDRDMNNDGFHELLVGAFNMKDSNGVRTGVVTLYDGATQTEIFRVEGEQSTERLGLDRPDFLDDLDGDGVQDLLIPSSNWHKGSDVFAGRVLIVSGADGTTLWEGQGSGAEGYGAKATRLADFNGDGIAEFCWVRDFGDRLLIYSGIPGEPYLDIHFNVIVSVQQIRAISDRTDDGVPDIILSGLLPPHGGSPGKMLVLSGATGEIVHDFDIPPDASLIGEVVDEAELTGDGKPDLLVVNDGFRGTPADLWLLQTRSLFRVPNRLNGRPGPIESDPLLRLEAPAHAGGDFAILFSGSARVGTPFGTRTLPLDPGPLLDFSFARPIFGTLDSNGHAVVRATLPPRSLLPSGRVHACWLGLDSTAPVGVRVISSPLSIPLD